VRRDDQVTVAVRSDRGRPGPALVIQTDRFPGTDSVQICSVTTTPRAASLFRLALPANKETGQVQPSQVMVDKIEAVRRDRCGAKIGKVDGALVLALNRLLAFALGATGLRS
jgi:mRNA interferase MazF